MSAEINSIGLYLNQIAETPLLSPDEEISLAKTIEAGKLARETLATMGNPNGNLAALEEKIRAGNDAMDRVVRANTRFVVFKARKFQGRGLPLDDLIQEGNIGLIRGLKKYDYRRGYKIGTYVGTWIEQGIRRAIVDKGRNIRISAHGREKIVKIKRANDNLIEALGREPTEEEIAQETGLKLKMVKLLIKANQTTLSLDSPGEDESSLADIIPAEDSANPEAEAQKHSNAQWLYDKLAMLPEKEAATLILLHGLDGNEPLGVVQIGKFFGNTREAVRKTHNKAIARLRRLMAEH